MTAPAAAEAALDTVRARLAAGFVRWLEDGVRPHDLFADDVFLDLTVPHWRVQAQGADQAFRVREDGHPYRGEVTVRGLDPTPRGFLIEFEERWLGAGQRWYCRELIHAIVAGDRIEELLIYCSGDWDQEVQTRHAHDVRLLRP